MKKILSLTILTLTLTGVGFSQTVKTDKNPHTTENKEKQKIRERKPFEYDDSTFDAKGRMMRGASISRDAKFVSLAEILKKPEDFAGKKVAVKGVIVRSCKMEGCWMELAPNKEAKSVRVTFGRNHAFSIPLDAAGMRAKAEGVFTVKTLSREQVEHLEKEDGAKFDRRNADGTVTEISFEATGVELTKQTK
jgi:hypothetical protein